MVVEQFARILRARFGIVLLIVAAAIAASVAVSLIITPKYQASTTLVVEVRNTDPVLGVSGATILGDGKVSLILDIAGLRRMAQHIPSPDNRIAA